MPSEVLTPSADFVRVGVGVVIRMDITPTSEDLSVRCLVVAVHGIGNQFRYSTVQSVERQFGEFCSRPLTQPLGAFHPAKMIVAPDSPELGAYLFEPPAAFSEQFGGFGFAEVFWADIPECAADTKNTTEESKEWAETLVQRVRALDESNSSTKSDLIDYKKASAVVAEMIDTIRVLENLLFIAKKAGLFEFHLGQLLTDFLGDVQIVADFKDYGGDVFERFAKTMRNLTKRLQNVSEIYIVAHSEGAVVSLRGLLTAMSVPETDDNAWVNKVRGYMTIGSPLNKHVVMFPALWKGLQPDASRKREGPILWRNYYDLGDPVGFDLQITRDWLKENGWAPKDGKPAGAEHFSFTDTDDHGFTRYPLPGKAHNDYWNDQAVFGHFIKEVVLERGTQREKPPTTLVWAWIVSRIFPYFLCFGLIALGVYFLYSALISSMGLTESTRQMVGNVIGLSSLLAGVTLLSRLPRLEKVWFGAALGSVAYIASVAAYIRMASGRTQTNLSYALLPRFPLGTNFGTLPFYNHGIVWVGLLIAVIAAIFSKVKPAWGMRPLIALGGLAAFWILWHLIKSPLLPPTVRHIRLWPIALANGAFLYLWWLAALIFDLVFIWHRFICSFRTTKTLQQLRTEAPSPLRA